MSVKFFMFIGLVLANIISTNLLIITPDSAGKYALIAGLILVDLSAIIGLSRS